MIMNPTGKTEYEMKLMCFRLWKRIVPNSPIAVSISVTAFCEGNARHFVAE